MPRFFRRLFSSLAILGTLLFGVPIAPAHAAVYSALRVTTTGGGAFTMAPDEVKAVTVTFQNTSDFTWKNDGPGYVSLYTYGPKYRPSVFDPGTWLSPSQVKRMIEPSVAKKGTATFTFQLHAPKTTGTYAETFKLASENYAWFDGGEFTLNISVKNASAATTSTTSTGSSASSSSATTNDQRTTTALLSVVSANKIKLVSGKSATLSAVFKNTGTTTWTSYGLQAADVAIASSSATSALALKHSSWNGNQIALASGTIKPGESATVTFAVTAPRRNGTYTTNFHLTANGEEIDDAAIQIPVEVTGGAPEAKDAPKNENGEVASITQQIPEPTIRVGVLIVDEETENEVVVTSNDSAFDVIDGAGKTLGSLDAGEEVTAAWDGAQYTYEIGGVTKKTDQFLRFVPKTANAVMTVTNFDRRVTRRAANADNTFRNVLELRYNTTKERTWLINELPMEYYLRGLGETSNVSPGEFQKALLTAARTYAFYHWTRATKHAKEFFHVDAYADQVYFGYGQEARTPNITAGVEATRGQIVTYNGETAITAYFSRSDGRTRDWSEVWGGEVPWCKSVPVPWDEGKTLWGHGVGLSASGALAMAKEGQAWDTILKYFYTGIALTKRWQ